MYFVKKDQEKKTKWLEQHDMMLANNNSDRVAIKESIKTAI